MPPPDDDDVLGDLITGGAGDVAVEDRNVVRVDAQQFQRGVTVTGDVRRDRLKAQAIADGVGQVRLVFDNQNTHAGDANEPDVYRQRLENRIRAGNTTVR